MDYYQFTSGSRPFLPYPASHPRSAAVPSSSASASSSSSGRPPPPRRSRYTMDGIVDEFPSAAPLTGDPNFDIIDWHPAYQSCQRYFLDHAQHEPGTQALCALINIRLPFQSLHHPITSSTPPQNNNNNTHSPSPSHSASHFALNAHLRPPTNGLHSPAHSSTNGSSLPAPPTFVSLIPYIRRLIVTGFDKPPILHGFFGDDYARGVSPHLDCERRNYLFAAKHGGWRTCKKHYDAGSGGAGDESVPFMKPLEETRVEEILAAEKAWSQWLAMEDWMVGPRAPGEAGSAGGAGGGGSSQGSTARGGGVDGMSDRGR